ncbi:MAG: phosphatase PAP2 family protein [bacterium]|nr:phosphatase PAP2 family protein [bacterium]
MLKKTILSGLLFCLLLLLIVRFAPLAFTATEPGNWWTSLAYFFTESGGTLGTIVGIVIACYLYTINETGIKNKAVVFGKAIIGLSLIIGANAAINEKITKPILKLQRPSHVYILNQLQRAQIIDSLYTLSKVERIAYFDSKIKEQPLLFKQIDPKILAHWVVEGGYSFPSGHTFNAFLLAMIFSLGIEHNSHSKKLQGLHYLPFVWALAIGISRVALGAHSWVDVSAGAFMGIAIGTLLLYIDFTRNLITHKH